MIKSITPATKLIHECTLPGESRSEDVFPAHPNGIQASSRTWLIIYCTRSWRCVDDDRSVVLQIRRDAPDGQLINEVMLQASIDDWDPFDTGDAVVRQQGHPCLFGVPKGAIIHNKPAENANVFAALWRVRVRGRVNKQTGEVIPDHEMGARSQDVQWMQFRLNDEEDDIEVLCPPEPLRRSNQPTDNPFGNCLLKQMNIGFVQPVKFDGQALEWAGPLHFIRECPDGKSQSVVAVARYTFNATSRRYEWTDLSNSLSAPGGLKCHEGSIARTEAGWLVCARSKDAIAWSLTDDPFTSLPSATLTTQLPLDAPVSLFDCADGQPRIFTGSRTASQYGMGRNPLFCWEVDPHTLRLSPPNELFDCIRAATLPESSIPRAEMCKLLPHAGGSEQVALFRVRTKNIGIPYGSLPPVTSTMKEAHGIFSVRVEYDHNFAAAWQF